MSRTPLVNLAEEFENVAEDIDGNLQDLNTAYNSMDQIVIFHSHPEQRCQSKKGQQRDDPGAVAWYLPSIQLMKDFEKISENDAVNNIARMERLAGKDDLKQRQIQKVRASLKDVKDKYGRNKSDFMLNANIKNAASFAGHEG